MLAPSLASIMEGESVTHKSSQISTAVTSCGSSSQANKRFCPKGTSLPYQFTIPSNAQPAVK